MLKGRVFDVQRYTLHDGPGIRTEIFLKGCPLRCRWCGNPESWQRELQPGVYPSKCIGEGSCSLCKKDCPASGALRFEEGRIRSIDRAGCTNCMKCAQSCPAEAIRQWGSDRSVEELMEIILRDAEYFRQSSGGVTISGGEPFLQGEFVTALLSECKRNKIHTCVETTLYPDWEVIRPALAYTDLVITDLKVMDPETHREYTGVSNERILQNMIRLSETDMPLIVRIPVIPSVNDGADNRRETADFILEKLHNKIEHLQLLEYMHLGMEKYSSLDMEYPISLPPYDKDEFSAKVREAQAYFAGRGISCILRDA